MVSLDERLKIQQLVLLGIFTLTLTLAVIIKQISTDNFPNSFIQDCVNMSFLVKSATLH